MGSVCVFWMCATDTNRAPAVTINTATETTMKAFLFLRMDMVLPYGFQLLPVIMTVWVMLKACGANIEVFFQKTVISTRPPVLTKVSNWPYVFQFIMCRGCGGGIEKLPLGENHTNTDALELADHPPVSVPFWVTLMMNRNTPVME